MIVLVGASASGKTELSKFLFHHFDYKKCVTTTTRPPRINEVDGIDYHFLTKKRFQELILQDAFFEVTQYQNHYYGIQKKDVFTKGVVIVDPSGANTLIDKLDDRVFVIYVHATKHMRKRRMKKRKDDDELIQKRLSNDENVFKKEHLKRIDLWIENEENDLLVLATEIHQAYQSFCMKT